MRAREETSLVGFVNILLRHRVLIVASALLTTAVFGIGALMQPRGYTTRVLFTAQGAQSGLLAGIAAQYGLSIVGSDPSQSLEFYEDLIRSPELLREVAKHQYQVHTEKGIVRGTLPVVLGIHAGSRDAEIDLAALQIRGNIAGEANRRTGIVTYLVSTNEAELAQQIAATIITELDRYNTETRRSQAGAERRFIESRLEESGAALARAEDNLRSFRDLNREYATSARLSLENDRLNREVTMRQQLYTALSQAYEQARIQEVKDIPAITVMESPALPTEANFGYGLRNTLLGTVAGIFLGIVLALIRERMRETEVEGSPTYAEFSELKREAMRDLARPWRPVERFFRSGA
jgi:uncharacterized protein involved in exopolysaccharide biosynthesis